MTSLRRNVGFRPVVQRLRSYCGSLAGRGLQRKVIANSLACGAAAIAWYVRVCVRDQAWTAEVGNPEHYTQNEGLVAWRLQPYYDVRGLGGLCGGWVRWGRLHTCQTLEKNYQTCFSAANRPAGCCPTQYQDSSYSYIVAHKPQYHLHFYINNAHAAANC